ncbi:MAG: hypothetical protein V1663_01755 [archaeon]
MKYISNILQNYLVKPVLAISLFSSLSIEPGHSQEKINHYVFNSFGTVDNIFEPEAIGNNIKDIKTADLDGDGDLDLIVFTEYQIMTYENQIPQKK